LESHGRFSETLDLSRTVGWFTTLYPISLEFNSTRTIADNLKFIKSLLRAVPTQGKSYGLLRYTAQVEEIAITPPISFNYLGQLEIVSQSRFQRIDVPNTCQNTNQATTNHRSHLLDINSWVESSQLKVEWTFSRHYHQPQTIQTLAEQFLSNLSALINHCCVKEVVEYTPDDFGLAQLDQSALESVLSQVSFGTEAPATQEVTT